MDILESFVKDVITLPSLPAIAVRIIREVKKNNFSIGKLADIISVDPSLTAKVLKIANSSFYSLQYKVDSIEKAINVLGVNALKNAALTFVIVTGFNRKSTGKFNHEFFWRRAITAAVSARMIASAAKMKSDDIFVTSLLMDVGVLTMYLSKPDDYMKVLEEKKTHGINIIEAERSVFGFDHQDVGGEILNSWGIPESIYWPISYHHNNENCPPELTSKVNILTLADMASSVYHGKREIRKIEELKHLLKNTLNIDETEVTSFIDTIAEKTIEILSFYEIDAGDMKPCSEILQEANQELGRVNQSCTQLVADLNEAKQDAENLAVELWQTKEKMKEIAIRDVLTGLHNHRYFHELMDKEMERIERFGHVMSIAMIDIDNFKNINDTYGHLNGDEVLRSIGKLLMESVRLPDVATRYGGEEFTIILPETDTKGAVIVTERIRQMVEGLEVIIGSQKITITISLGITTYDPRKGTKTKSEIMHAADMAMYKSKAAGKNRLSISSSPKAEA
jgi:diguanylate cyclase (GGDEF)-like protein